ncbi:PD-(D/E)XK nuclease family protein, partial [Thermodesulfovibrio yellowstonii]|uniref:PD-(D/E)XK nuclease family protein n=2 Tax=Thermodesulfovibrio yellowstonii TaxID=28262 RepID=UPI003C7DAB3B
WEESQKRWEETQAEWNRKWEESQKRWEETQAEWNRKWEESQKRWEETQAEWNRKWEENQKTINQILLRLEKIDRRHLYTIGALGARWGLYSEESFRNGLKAIIEESFGIEVMRYIDYDHTGEVFGHPDQIELDLIIRNGMVIACEIKSSMSKSDMYTLWRKKEFYERKHQRKVDRVIVISPMVDPRAKPVAEKLGIEIYTHSDEFVETEEKNIEDITK